MFPAVAFLLVAPLVATVGGREGEEGHRCQKFSLPQDDVAFMNHMEMFLKAYNRNDTKGSTSFCNGSQEAVTDELDVLTKMVTKLKDDNERLIVEAKTEKEERKKETQDIMSNQENIFIRFEERMDATSFCNASQEAVTDELDVLTKMVTKLKDDNERLLVEAKTEKDERKKETQDILAKLTRIMDNTNRLADCSDLLATGETKSGVYTIHPSRGLSVKAFCDMTTEGGGWTIFIARMNQSNHISFNRTWEEYKHGFGSPESEYWLGNDNLHRLTSARNYTVRLEARAYDGSEIWSEWNTFKVDSESNKYKLTVEDFNEKSVGSKLHFTKPNGMLFSTLEEENDIHDSKHCAQLFSGAGWWYSDCYNILPTGVHGRKDNGGIHFYKTWSKTDEETHFAHWLQLKVRPAR